MAGKTANPLAAKMINCQLIEGYKAYHLKQQWADFVGIKLADHSYISKIENKEAIVVVSNSTYLSFLYMKKNNILEKMNEFMPGLVEDIKFISGRNKIKDQGEDTHSLNKQKKFIQIDSVVLEKEKVERINEEVNILPEPLRKKMQKLRYSAARKEKIYEISAYYQCSQCKSWIPEDEICFSCYTKSRKELKTKIYKYLKDLPWSTYEELKIYISCDELLYAEVKREYIYRLLNKIYGNSDNAEDRMILTMLVSKKKPNEITDDYITNLTNKFRRK